MMPREATQFKKGMTPWNKGIKGYMGANRTSFKPGGMPPNTREIGSLRITKDGYLEIKVDNKKKWKALHLLVFQELVGEIPKGHIVVFKDKNKLNLSPDNLLAISRAENALLNKSFSKDPAEIKETRLAQVKLRLAVKEKTKDKQ